MIEDIQHTSYNTLMSINIQVFNYYKKGGANMKLQKIKENKKLLVSILSIAIIAVMLVPTMYSFTYLGSVWDVYGKIDKVPVAFVNLDKSVIKDGKKYELGKDVENNLKKDNSLNWQFVNYKEAVDGVNGTKYYAVIEIPENFSENIANIQDGKFKKPQIVYIGNKGRNFVFSQISSKAAESIKTRISSSIQKEISETLVTSLYDVKGSIKNAAYGTQELKSGTEKLTNGSNELSTGLNTAASGSVQLSNGLQKITDGENKIVSGFPALVDGLNTLKSNLTKPNDKVSLLVNGASSLNTNTGAIVDGAGKLDTSVSALAYGIKKSDAVLHGELAAINNSNLSQEDKYKLTAAIKGLDQVSTTNTSDNSQAPLTKVTSSVHQLSSSLNQLKGGTQQLSNGVTALSSGLTDTQNKAAEGLDKLISGANNIQNGNSSVLTGLNTVTAKTGELSNGLNKLSSGSASLTNGLQTVDDGTGKLKDGLNEGYNKMNSNLKFNSNNMSQFISKPVTLKDDSINTISNYGEGLAPYFISLSLWLGAMFANLMFSIIKSLKIFKSKLMNSFIGNFIVESVIVTLQSFILSFTLINGLNLNPVNVPEFYILNAFISIAFLSVMHGLSYAMGPLSGAVMFVVLILQLASSGGTFPIETAPVFYKIVNKIVPMTYSVNTIRMTISGINKSALNNNISIMLIFIATFLCGGFIIRKLIDYVKNKKHIASDAKAA